MKKYIFVLFIFCSFNLKADDQMIADAIESVKTQLKDPYSANFRDVRANISEVGKPVVCGSVNAKNSYGAYSGYKRFYFTARDKPASIEDQSNPVFSVIYEALCNIHS